MVRRDGVVEDENERAAWSGSSNVNGPHVIVAHYGPNFIFCVRNTHTHTLVQIETPIDSDRVSTLSSLHSIDRMCS